jgi:hypothetical protein
MTLLRSLVEQAGDNWDITFHCGQQILELDGLAFIEVGDDSACRVLIGEDECWECQSDSPSELAGTVMRLVDGYCCRTPPLSSCSPPDTVASTPPTGCGA